MNNFTVSSLLEGTFTSRSLGKVLLTVDTIVHLTALHYTLLQYTPLHYTILHYTTHMFGILLSKTELIIFLHLRVSRPNQTIKIPFSPTMHFLIKSQNIYMKANQPIGTRNNIRQPHLFWTDARRKWKEYLKTSCNHSIFHPVIHSVKLLPIASSTLRQRLNWSKVPRGTNKVQL